MGSAILWQQRLERDVDAEQIMQRVLILGACEPAATHTAICGDVGTIRREQRGLQCGEEKLLLRLLRLRFLFWRHFTSAHALIDVLPGVQTGGIQAFQIERGQIQAGFLHI